MKREHAQILLGIMMWLLAHLACAYELSAHAQLTYAAYLQSILADQVQSPVPDLGIGMGNEGRLGGMYYDFQLTSPAMLYERAIANFEGGVIERSSTAAGYDAPQPGSVALLLMAGAIREDDVLTNGDNPLDDPFGNFYRVVGHFYDPVHDTGLTTLPVRWWTPAVSLGPRNPDWALGATDFLGNPNVPALSSGETRLPSPSVAANHFSLMHARRAGLPMARSPLGRMES